MAGSVALPFIADRIPSALPTNTEIQASKEILSQYGSRTVARVGRDFVVKYGRGVDIIEGENMLYVQRMTKIAIPKVYAIYTEPVTRMNYIVMEHIDGDTLAARWPCLSDEQKELVMVKLRRYFDELRRLPQPGYFGSLDRRCLLDDVFWTHERVVSINVRSTLKTLSTRLWLRNTYRTVTNLTKRTSIAAPFVMFFWGTSQHLPMRIVSVKT
jgi:hypothetical protein